MNPTNILLLAVICMMGITFFACDASSQQHEVTHAEVQHTALSSGKESKDALRAAQKASKTMEWEAMKIDFEAEFRENEIRIEGIKAKMKRIAALEQTNRKLKANIVAYQQDQVDWELFKRAFIYDANALRKELDDLSGQRKK